jgi:hypothetical protein
MLLTKQSSPKAIASRQDAFLDAAVCACCCTATPTHAAEKLLTKRSSPKNPAIGAK